MEVVKWIFVVAELAGVALVLVDLVIKEPDDAADSDRLPDGLAGTWERKTPDGRGLAGGPLEGRLRGEGPGMGGPRGSKGVPQGGYDVSQLHHGRHHIQRHPVGRFRAGTHTLLQGKETVMRNDIDFRKAVRLMEEARDRLDEASEILGVFDTGDVSGENTIADKAASVDQDIDDIKAIAERMGEEI